MLTVRALLPHDIDRICDLMPNFELYLRKPGFKLSMCRVGLLNGEVIGYVLVEPRLLRYGRASLNVVMMGSVFVENSHRAHGYDTALMQDALAFVAEQGAHLAFIHASEGYGARFGFSPVFPYYLLSFDSSAAARLRVDFIPRPLEIRDVPTIAALYEKHWNARVALQRNAELWLWRIEHGDLPVEVIETQDEGICGYIAGNSLQPEVELVADSPSAARTLIGTAGRRYRHAGFDEVRWLIPPDDALVTYARQMVDVTVSARYAREGGWTGRLIETTTLLDVLLPEITAQAMTGDLRDFAPERLVLRCKPTHVDIGLDRQPETFSALAHHDFIQLLFGSTSAGALALTTRLHPSAVRLLGALFPTRAATLAVWDWF